MRRAAFILALSVAASAARAEAPRIVTAGSAVTEIVCALGLGTQLVAVDTSSKHLDETRDKPDIGYVRQLGAEGVLSQRPDLVIVSGEAGPPEVLDQIRAAGIGLLVVEKGETLESIPAKIRTIAKATGRGGQGDALAAKVEAETGDLRRKVAAGSEKPSVIFLMARHGGNLMAAGRGTAAHAMIEASGGCNAGDSFDGYKPLSPEIFAASAPDYVIVSESVGTDDAAFVDSVPGLPSTPAGKNSRIIRVDDTAFLGFGPRAPASAMAVAGVLQKR